MSKQSERKRQELAEAKAAAKLLKSQQNRQNQNTVSYTETKNGEQNPETNTKKSFIDFIERPGLIGLFVAFFIGSAGFAFFYNHTLSIWLFFLFLVGCCQGLRVELKLHGKKSRFWPNFLGITLFIFSLIVCVLLQVLESPNVKPLIKSAIPPFDISIPNSDKPEQSLELTNDCFAPHEWDVIQEFLGVVLIPIKIGQSNFSLSLRVHSSVLAEKLEVFATVPTDWGVVADRGWVGVVVEQGKPYSVSNGVVKLNEMQSWVYRSPIDLLPGDGLTLPSILFSNLEKLMADPLKTRSPQIGGITIVVKAKGLLGGVGFRPFFLQTSNGYSFTPIAVTLFHTNKEAAFLFSYPLKETNGTQ